MVVEGLVDTKRTDGKEVKLAFCDVFDLRDGKIQKLTSYLMQTSK
jgi:ketosteroid isomerase-like protein